MALRYLRSAKSENTPTKDPIALAGPIEEIISGIFVEARDVAILDCECDFGMRDDEGGGFSSRLVGMEVVLSPEARLVTNFGGIIIGGS